MAMTRKDSAIGKQFVKARNFGHLIKDFEQESTALGYGNGVEPGIEEVDSQEDAEGDAGFEEDQDNYESDEYSEDDDYDGGFQAYEEYKERRRAADSYEEAQKQAPSQGGGNEDEDKALTDLIQSIKQDSIELGIEQSTGSTSAEGKVTDGEVDQDNLNDDQEPPRNSNDPKPPQFVFRSLPIRQPASIPPVPRSSSLSWPIGQQPLPQFVPPATQNRPTYIPFRPTLPPYLAPGPFAIPDPLQRSLPNGSIRPANPSLPSLRGPRPVQRSAPQAATQPASAPPPPAQATHYAGPARRIKPKTRLASNLTPRLPNGTIDFEVKTCLHEMKREGSEFNFNGNYDGNQKCARVLKRLYPHKFPDWISVSVLADRLQQTWYARSDRPGRNQTREWKRIVEMRNGDGGLRRALRLRIRETGVR